MMCAPPIAGAIMDIVVWLRSLGLGKYEAVFRENDIDETVLPSLTHENLKDLGVASLGHRVKLLDAIAALRTDARLEGSVALTAPHSRYQLQPCAHSALCVVLVGLRIAEVDQDAVAHVLRYEAAKALHSLGDALLIGRNDFAQVLRVHARRQRR